MPANSLRSRTKGYLIGVLGVLILSPDTLLIRLVDTSPWTFLTWRGGLMTIGMILVLSLSYRSKLLEKIHAVGWLGLLIALIFAINTTFFQLSVQTTNVSNTLVIIATAPLFAAILSVIFLVSGPIPAISAIPPALSATGP